MRIPILPVSAPLLPTAPAAADAPVAAPADGMPRRLRVRVLRFNPQEPAVADAADDRQQPRGIEPAPPPARRRLGENATDPAIFAQCARQLREMLGRRLWREMNGQLIEGFALGQADVVLVLGTPLDFRLGYGRPPSFAENVRVAMVDCDPAELGRNRPLAVGLTSHIGLTLRALADAAPRDAAARVAPWRDAVRKKETEAQARLMAERLSHDVPISHYRLAHEIAAVVDGDTTVVGDGGDVVGCASKIVRLSRPGQWLDPGPFGCLGVGPSFAIAARLLRPAQRVLLIAGDGAFGLNGMELETAVRFGLPMTVVIGNDGGWGQIRNPQLSFFGAERSVATSLPFTRYERMVEALGGRGCHVTEPGQLRPALERALGSGEVHCINVVLDPAAYRRTGQVSMAI